MNQKKWYAMLDGDEQIPWLERLRLYYCRHCSNISPVTLLSHFSLLSSPMRKIRIPMASLEESHNVKRVEEDRTIAIEAAIVRIMKVKIHMLANRQILFNYHQPNSYILS